MSEEKNVLTESTTGSVTEGGNKRIQDQKRVAVIKGPDNYGMYFLGFSAGGEMPLDYKNNRYTSHSDAERALAEFNRDK